MKTHSNSASNSKPSAGRYFIERLEPRIAPANVVMTALAGGTLSITTVDQLSEAAILAAENNQNLKLTGTGPGNVTVEGIGATTVDGLTSKNFAGVTKIVLNLKLGNDNVTTVDLDITGDLVYNGGHGGNLLNLDTSVSVTKVRNLSVTHLEGVDNFAILGPIIIGGNLTINNGNGGSNTNIGFLLSDDVTIQGAVIVSNGDGNDNTHFFGDDFLVQGPITINNGNGDSSTIIGCDNSMVMQKPLKITSGAGNDSFNVVSNTATTNFAGITLNNGNGNSSVTFASSVSDTINGNLMITNAAGNDSVAVNSAAFAVTGMVKINNGTGDTTTDLSPNTSNTVAGGLFVTNGAGAHATTISATTVNYKSVAIGNGTGNSTLQMTGTDLTFGSISVINRDGTDSLTVAASNKFEVIAGGVTIKNGNGGSTTTLGATNTASIQGALQITNNDGNDTVLIGNGAGNFSGLHSISINHGVGTGATTFNPAQLTITGSLSVTGGDGSDGVTLGAGTLSTFVITQGLAFKAGRGGSNITSNPTNAGNVGGTFNVTGMDGFNEVDLLRTTIMGPTVFSGGSGTDLFEIDNSTLAGLMIRTGGGFDLVAIEHNSNDGISSTIGGLVTIDLGAADDRIEFGLDGNDRVTALKAVRFIGGSEVDTFNQFAAANVFQIAPVLSGFEVTLP